MAYDADPAGFAARFADEQEALRPADRHGARAAADVVLPDAAADGSPTSAPRSTSTGCAPTS